MAVVRSPEAQAIIDRLAAVSRTSPTIDRERAEQAFAAHLLALGLTPVPVRWVVDAGAGWSAARSAAESAAWSAAESATCQHCAGIWLPFVDAFEAGLWLFWILDKEVIAVPRPVLCLEGDRLHCADGPAVWWPHGQRFFFWRGVQVHADVILHPEQLTVKRIQEERNAEVRRVCLERYGWGRYLLDSGAQVVHADEFGTLYSTDLPDDEPLVMVSVVNSTAEPDGSFKPYLLRVPPTMTTAREAVAWTFGVTATQYAPSLET